MLANLLMTLALWPQPITEYCRPTSETLVLGIARSSDGKFLYCEQIDSQSKNALTIIYWNNGKKIAQKNLRYGEDFTRPAVEQIDSRSGEQRIAIIDGKNLTMKYQASQADKMKSTSVPLKDVDIVDAGFDYFIRQHWDKLQSGKGIDVKFASMAHQKVLPLRIRHLSDQKCHDLNSTIKEHHCYQVEIDNAFLRLLLGNIKLAYDKQQRLITYKGTVNIEDSAGESQIAKIDYYYKDDFK